MSTETYRDHVEQQEKHIKNHIGDEIRKVKEREERETHGFHDVIGDEIAHEETAERRPQDETDAALTEPADTILRGEEAIPEKTSCARAPSRVLSTSLFWQS